MQDVHWMTVCACENTVLMEVHPGHLTSMKYEFGPAEVRESGLFSPVALVPLRWRLPLPLRPAPAALAPHFRTLD